MSHRLVWFLCASIGVAAAPLRAASAHALLVTPQPRDQQDGYKDPPRNIAGSSGAPCGIMRNVLSQPQTTYAAGQPLHVEWKETVDHPGCFVIDFAAAGDASFQVLGVKSHATAAGTTPRNWSVDVTLPAAPCTACTLRLRQLMLSADVSDAQCPPATIPSGSTYYSCANVVLTSGGAVPDAGNGGTGTGGSTGGGTGGNAGAGQGGAGGSTTGGGGGGGGGCSVGDARASWIALVVVLLVAAAMRRRRSPRLRSRP